jgi:rifampin ADP-ribosylating transferase
MGENAAAFDRTGSSARRPPSLGVVRFYLGMKDDLKPGDLVEPGHSTGFLYATSTLDGASWEAELAPGDGPGRIYEVEPIGRLVEAPDLAAPQYPVPTKWFRTQEPLRVTGECTDPEGRPRRFYHGTKAALTVGDLIQPGYAPNFGEKDRVTKYVYLTGTVDAAIWGAELALGDGAGRVYVVEPTGPIMDDPNLTDQKFRGNPTKSYRSQEALRVISEHNDWEGHSPEVLQAMKDNLEALSELGVEPIDD